MNYQNLINEAQEEVQNTFHSSMTVGSCGYDGLVNKIQLIFYGLKDGKRITTSKWIDVPCHSEDDLEKFKIEHCENFI